MINEIYVLRNSCLEQLKGTHYVRFFYQSDDWGLPCPKDPKDAKHSRGDCLTYLNDWHLSTSGQHDDGFWILDNWQTDVIILHHRLKTKVNLLLFQPHLKK